MKGKLLILIAAASVLACGRNSANVTIIPEGKQIKAISLIPVRDCGEMRENAIELIPGEDGRFHFEVSPETGFGTFLMRTDKRYQNAIHIEKGANLTITLKDDGNKGLYCEFDGKGADESRCYDCLEETFDFMKLYRYYDDRFNLDSLRADIDLKKEKFEESLAGVKDKKNHGFYEKLGEACYKDMIVRLYEMNAELGNGAATDYPEFVEISENIDPNDIFSARSTLLITWAHNNLKRPLPKRGDGTLEQYCMEFLNLIDKEVSQPDCRKNLLTSCVFTFFFGNPKDNFENVWTRLEKETADCPEVIEEYVNVIESWRNTGKGKPAPDITLTKPDGQECQLSSLFGKFLYIDVWATWCKPCCMEIPYLEKVAAHFKGDDRISIISISMDSGVDIAKWRARIKADNPDWPQYVLKKEAHEQFSNDWGINSIPRFIMIDREGKIYNADAERPSSEGIIELIESML